MLRTSATLGTCSPPPYKQVFHLCVTPRASYCNMIVEVWGFYGNVSHATFISRIRSCYEAARFGAMGLTTLIEKRAKLLAAAHEKEAGFASDYNEMRHRLVDACR